MNRLLVLGLIAAALGCGTKFYVRGAINPQFVSGTISTAQLSLVTEGDVTITVTIVTFLEGTGTTGVTFCGDQSSQFLPGDFVQASFTPGPPCANVLQIIINGP